MSISTIDCIFLADNIALFMQTASAFIKNHIEWCVAGLLALCSSLLYLNAIIYKRYIKAYWDDIYDMDAHTNNISIKEDKTGYITAVYGILRMKHKRIIFWGILSTVIWFIIMWSLRRIDKPEKYFQTIENALISEQDLYEKYKNKLKIFDKLFPILYWCIHHGRGKSIWIKSDR